MASRDDSPSARAAEDAVAASDEAARARLSAVLIAASRGDESAWRELVGLYGRRVFALAKGRLGNTDVAEEITQSVMATVATKLSAGGYTEQGKFEPWLFRVTMNRVRDEARRARHRARATDPGSAVFSERASAAAEGSAEDGAGVADRLRRALAGLSDADREVIELRHHGQMSFKQMAEMLGEPLGTLLARHHRALKKLKDLVSAEPSGHAGAAAVREASR